MQAEAEADDLDDADEDDVIDGDEDDLEDEAEDPLAQMNSGMPGEVAPEDTLDYTDYDHGDLFSPFSSNVLHDEPDFIQCLLWDRMTIQTIGLLLIVNKVNFLSVLVWDTVSPIAQCVCMVKHPYHPLSTRCREASGLFSK